MSAKPTLSIVGQTEDVSYVDTSEVTYRLALESIIRWVTKTCTREVSDFAALRAIDLVASTALKVDR